MKLEMPDIFSLSRKGDTVGFEFRLVFMLFQFSIQPPLVPNETNYLVLFLDDFLAEIGLHRRKLTTVLTI